MELRGKKVLQMGLGILGGGVATARWLVEQGTILTITDLKDKDYLASSLEKLKDLDIQFVLGKHEEKDFLETDVLVINPDVPANNKFVELARSVGKLVENELTLFYKFRSCKVCIGITGTRGKTTTTNWIGHILKSAGKEARVIGNDPEKPFLSEIKNCGEDTIAVIETPSFQLEILEIMGDSGLAPHVAVVTNLYQDHLSRHKTMEGYALAKANIFINQEENDFLILNGENEWTEFFLNLKPKSRVVFPSTDLLPGFEEGKFVERYGRHNLANFLAAAAACLSVGISVEEVLKTIDNLPQVKWRQESVYNKNDLKIYNDTAATSPEAAISAVERFSSKNYKFILIAGGTDRELDFTEWGKQIQKSLTPENLVLLSGSATEKMKKELPGWQVAEFDNLEDCLKTALGRVDGPATIALSPGAKSFEKFKNEFDRGEKFNEVVKKLT